MEWRAQSKSLHIWSNNVPQGRQEWLMRKKLLLQYRLGKLDNHLQKMKSNPYLKFSSVQSLSCVWLFVTPWTAARLVSLSIANSQSLLKLMSIESVMPSNHLILVIHFSSWIQSFPVSGSVQMSQFFTWGGQSMGVSASASVLPMNIQDWFPWGSSG